MLRLFIILILSICNSYARDSHGLIAKFSFDKGIARNEITKSAAKIVGATLTEDRFGNPASAYYLHGNIGSYINLGTDASLKPRQGTISLWFKMDNFMYAGKGYEANPVILTKSHSGNNFNEAYCFSCNFNSKRLMVATDYVNEQDSIQAIVSSNMAIKLGKWYHAVMCYDDSSLYLYVNGVLQNRISKKFPTKFLEEDSVVLGNSASMKNMRYFNGAVDDIEIYDHVLLPAEIMKLYDAADPNKNHYIIKWLIIILVCVTFAVLLMLILLKREKIKNREQRQLYEMETQVMKAQMNPHFIFNAVNSVQQFILADDNTNAYKYLERFSKLLRMILESNHENNISLENEIDMLTRYIEIESLRFDKAFTYEIVTDAGINTSKTRIPQMLVQPIVENAIWHGLLPQKDNRKLSIHFKTATERMLLCYIDDNGVGRSNDESEVKFSKKRPMAINFIRKRLQLMSKEFEEDYDIEIIDKVDEFATGRGTKVIIKLPILN